jgi:hypothetical protein
VARVFQPVGVANTDTNRNTGWKARGTPEVGPLLPVAAYVALDKRAEALAVRGIGNSTVNETDERLW